MNLKDLIQNIFSNNESEKNTFNFALSFKKILTNYYERK